ncbi:hypothetical protein E2C01_002160 [Portunus trituberculatus]|uniref:Uncharacterized protein n=1 Tax=Portunus trituberculatus TaxID=210409 RepID=A0A5B7CME3_PORTR|nr:hypothetical protein [Portunus trituberculatus]
MPCAETQVELSASRLPDDTATTQLFFSFLVFIVDRSEGHVKHPNKVCMCHGASEQSMVKYGQQWVDARCCESRRQCENFLVVLPRLSSDET